MIGAKSHRIKTISEFHQIIELPGPEHPLISVINLEEVKRTVGKMPVSRILDFYTISLKRIAILILNMGSRAMKCRAVSCTLLHLDRSLFRR